MKKAVIILCTLALACSCTFSFNNNSKRVVCMGDVVEKTLDLADFNAINVKGSSDMVITQSDVYSVKVTANEQVFEHLDYEVNDGWLEIKTIDNVQIVAKTYKIYVSVPSLENLQVNGAADAEINNFSSDKDLNVMVNGAGDFELSGIQVPSLSFVVNGAGDIEAAGLDVENVSVTVTGAGDVHLSGKAKMAKMVVTGAGDIDASGLEVEDWELNKNGFTSVKLPKKVSDQQ